MLSKTWLWPLALACGCRLGTPRPDSEGNSDPAAPVASPVVPAASAKGPAAAPDPSEKPAVLTLPGENEEVRAPAASPAVPSRAPARHRIVVLGDSLSDPRVGGGGYLDSLRRSCPSAQIENLAKGGWMVNQMRRRFEAEVLPRLADVDELIVFGGVNDLYSDESAGRTFAKISDDLTRIYRAAKAQGVRVIALTVTPWGDFSRYYNPRRAAATQKLNDWLRAQPQAGLVDVVVDANPLLSCGDPERLCAEYAKPFQDGLHFGKIGQQKLGAELLRTAFADCSEPR